MKNLKFGLTILFAFAMSLFLGAIVANNVSPEAGACTAALLVVWSIVGGSAYAKHTGMAWACGTISAAITTDCNNLPTPGIQPMVMIANKADIASYTLDPSNPTLCTAITMVAAKKFYKYTGLKKIGKSGMKTIKGKYKNFAEHNAEIAIMQNDPATKEELDNLMNGNVVLIVTNKSGGTTGNRKYEIYGLEAGMDCELENDKDNQDTQGGYLLKLKTPDGETEPHIPATFFDTDLATTDAAIVVFTT